MVTNLRLHALAFVGLLFLSAGLPGCSPSTVTVKGDVTFDGQLVEEGTIRFFPVEGQGPTTGGAIVRGRYEVKGVPLGPQRVEFTATEPLREVPPLPVAPSRSAQEARMRVLARIPRQLIPPDAEGNLQVIEVQGGVQVVNFGLKSASANRE
jgi:hypothetical protein